MSGLAYEQEHNIYVMPNGDILLEVTRNTPWPRPKPRGSLVILPSRAAPGAAISGWRGWWKSSPNGTKDTYTTVWQWSFWNHLVQDVDPQGQTFYTNSAGNTVYVSDYQPTINDPYMLNANYNGANTACLPFL